MKKLLLITLLMSSFCFAQKTVIIKTVETYGSFAAMKKQMIIVDENNNTEVIELEKHNTKGISINMVTFKEKLDSYISEGWELISSNGVSFGWQGVATIEHTYILHK